MAVVLDPTQQILIEAVFYLFATVAVIAAFLVITQNNPVRSVLFLVLAFFATAALWILANAEFLALILILVYVGAVMTLFLFVVMMLNVDIESKKTHLAHYLPPGLVLVSLLIGLMFISLPKGFLTHTKQISPFALEVIEQKRSSLPNTEQIGMVLYTDYVFALEIAAIILLVAIIAAITLVHRGAARSKRQNIRRQLMVNAKDRIQLIKMKTEK